jgi:hypothetical protein
MFKKKRNVEKPKIVNPGQVVIPAGHPNPPEPHEISTAWILARHYHASVQFLIPVDDYKRKSADIVMLGVEWEMKSPVGASKSTIENQFRRASKQARNIIIDTRRTSLDDGEIEKAVIRETKRHSTVRRVILVDKSEKIVEMSI